MKRFVGIVVAAVLAMTMAVSVVAQDKGKKPAPSKMGKMKSGKMGKTGKMSKMKKGS